MDRVINPKGEIRSRLRMMQERRKGKSANLDKFEKEEQPIMNVLKAKPGSKEQKKALEQLPQEYKDMLQSIKGVQLSKTPKVNLNKTSKDKKKSKRERMKELPRKRFNGSTHFKPTDAVIPDPTEISPEVSPKTSSEISSEVSSEVSTKVLSEVSSEVLPKVSSWTCVHCRNVNTTEEVCYACLSERDDAIWICRKCSVENSSLETCCKICEAPKRARLTGLQSVLVHDMFPNLTETIVNTSFARTIGRKLKENMKFQEETQEEPQEKQLQQEPQKEIQEESQEKQLQQEPQKELQEEPQEKELQEDPLAFLDDIDDLPPLEEEEFQTVMHEIMEDNSFETKIEEVQNRNPILHAIGLSVESRLHEISEDDHKIQQAADLWREEIGKADLTACTEAQKQEILNFKFYLEQCETLKDEVEKARHRIMK